MSRINITTAIPYVNGEPHLGHALELVETDVLARHRRLRGDDVRFLTGTDDNALKNVRAAEAEGIPVPELVGRNAGRFVGLREPLQLSNGDLYQRDYEGLYCAGCEAFLTTERCDEHPEPLERVAERNWFFRLSRYEEVVRAALESGRIRIEPAERRNEALAFVRAGLADLSVSRSRARAHGWGIPVPGDAGQVIYVWFDALGNYVTADPRRWHEADERVHVIGKGILRFHAVYWPAILLSAGLPLPTEILVHDYVNVDGRKLGKSLGNAVEPAALVERYGGDALRWWLLREAPLARDVDFREELLVARANHELANGIGNLVSRTIGLADGPREAPPALDALPAEIDAALERFDLRRATEAICVAVQGANRLVERTRPWELRGRERETVVAQLVGTCRRLAAELEPFLPEAAGRIAAALDGEAPAAVFPRLSVPEAARP
jgi:methionyl-tRNA synthetase